MFVLGQFLHSLNCKDQAALVLLKIDVECWWAQGEIVCTMRACIQFR